MDKVRESCSVWIPKFFILLRVEPNTLVWIDIGESLSLSCGACSTVDKDELPREVTILFKLRLSSRKEFAVIGFDSSVNHPIPSEFELGEDTGLSILEVATRRTSVRGWLNICHNYGRVKKWPLHMFLYHCYIDSHVYMRWFFLYFHCMDHCSCYMDYCYMNILVFSLHDCFSYWYWYNNIVTGHTGKWPKTCELSATRNKVFLFIMHMNPVGGHL